MLKNIGENEVNLEAGRYVLIDPTVAFKDINNYPIDTDFLVNGQNTYYPELELASPVKLALNSFKSFSFAAYKVETLDGIYRFQNGIQMKLPSSHIAVVPMNIFDEYLIASLQIAGMAIAIDAPKPFTCGINEKGIFQFDDMS